LVASINQATTLKRGVLTESKIVAWLWSLRVLFKTLLLWDICG